MVRQELSTASLPALWEKWFQSGPPAALEPWRRPIRVCFLIDRLSTAGTECQLLGLIRHLEVTRVEPFLCLLGGEDDESRALEPPGCPVIRLGVRSLHRSPSFRQAVRFGRFLKQNRIDVLQTYFPDSTYFGVLVGRAAGVPRVVRTRLNLGYWMKPRDRWLGRLYSLLVDATVTNCHACKEAVVREEWSRPRSVHILENGVDLAALATIPPLNPKPAPGQIQRVTLVANLRPIKDPETFVRAAINIARQQSEAIFNIAGEGELRVHLQSLVKQHGLTNRIRLLGRVTNIPALLAQTEIAVLCSLSEGAPNALLEYMAAGRAVVATAVGGSKDFVQHGRNGLLVPPGDPAALAAAIRELIDDSGRAARLGQAAREQAEERFDMALRARRFEEFYARLLSPASIGARAAG